MAGESTLLHPKDYFSPRISFKLSILALLGLAWLGFAHGVDEVLVLPSVDDLLFIIPPTHWPFL